MREAAVEKLERMNGTLLSVDALKRFFEEIREEGTEPDWEEHLTTMSHSRSSVD